MKGLGLGRSSVRPLTRDGKWGSINLCAKPIWHAAKAIIHTVSENTRTGAQKTYPREGKNDAQANLFSVPVGFLSRGKSWFCRAMAGFRLILGAVVDMVSQRFIVGLE